MPLRSPSSSGYDWPSTYQAVTASIAVVWVGANSARYLRSQGHGTISKVAIHPIVQSGNISVGVYTGSGVGNARVPAGRIATTGSMACPVGGYIEIALDGTVYVSEGDFFALSCDNATASFLGMSGNASSLYKGWAYTQATAHALPTSAGTLTATTSSLPTIIGIP